MKIVKVVSVVDTREYEEQGDSFVPIPGSGNSNTCSRCGREHEIHWTVLLEDGQNAVVGGSCAKAYSLDLGPNIFMSVSLAPKVILSTERLASRHKRLTVELSTYESRLADLERAIAEVAALPRPLFITDEMVLSSGTKIPTVRAGDGDVVWCQFSGTEDPERRRVALHSWESKRISERTKVKDGVYQLRALIQTTKKNLDNVRKKLSNIGCA